MARNTKPIGDLISVLGTRDNALAHRLALAMALSPRPGTALARRVPPVLERVTARVKRVPKPR